VEIKKDFSGGENIRTYDSGGIGRDSIRDHKHRLLHFGSGADTSYYNFANTGYYGRSYRTSEPTWSDILVDNAGATVPVGPENAVRTMAAQSWRKTS